MISPAFKNFLQFERAHCNQLFVTMRHQHPQIESDSFNQFLIEQLDPAIASLEASGKSISGFAMAGYQHGLELAAKRWLGNSEYYPLVQQLWRDLMPNCLPLINTQSDYWLSMLTNVIYRLELHSRIAAQSWLKLMADTVSLCQSQEELKSTGLVLAWISGLACYREVALRTLSELPDVLFVHITDLDARNRSQILQSLSANRWLDFSLETTESLSKQKRIGASLLYDGEFAEPPKIMSTGTQLIVTSANQHWMLFADAFGEMLVPIQDINIHSLNYKQDNSEWSLIMQTYLKSGIQARIPDIASLSSCAELNDTLALTSKDTFSILLFNR